jgi:hypothetical protein
MRRVLTWIVVASATLSPPSHAVVTHNRLATNRLATNALTTGALTADPSAYELLSTPEGRDLYSYVVSCALPAGPDIHATVPGAPDADPSSDLPYTCTSEECRECRRTLPLVEPRRAGRGVVEVEVYWKWTCGCAVSQPRMAGVRWDDELSRMTCSSRAGYARTTFSMKVSAAGGPYRRTTRAVLRAYGVA